MMFLLIVKFKALIISSKEILLQSKKNTNICQQIADAWNESFPELPKVFKVVRRENPTSWHL